MWWSISICDQAKTGFGHFLILSRYNFENCESTEYAVHFVHRIHIHVQYTAYVCFTLERNNILLYYIIYYIYIIGERKNKLRVGV